tara:strand:- start:35097 stop:37343 length:2247 start_codon:yes stop_codon:yes gene_type:complete
MSRLYLVVTLTFLVNVVTGQQELKKYLEFAQEKYEQGDYVYALQYYDKAMEIDSNSINTLWNYAQTLRAYKDYKKASFYYGKVFERENGELYPGSLLYYGLMLKQSGKYDEALDVFKRAKKHYRSDRRGYFYKKSRNEVQSCIWARSNVGDSSNLIFEHLPENINSVDSEFGHRVYGGQLYLSSLKADSTNEEVVYDTSYHTHIYRSDIKDSAFQDPEKVEDLFWSKYNSGNGSFSLDGSRFYFSFCEDEGIGYKCKILVAYVEDDRFVDIDTLGPIINEPGSNTTMPFIGEWEGDEVLFYASDREDGDGGMDIWYSFIKNGNQFRRPINVKRINSMDNELSPYWDSENTTLYFSSSWNNGFGGYDVFKSNYTTTFQAPENLREPINSPANDLYYFKTSSKDTAFFSSNRLGVNYSKNPTCCSDIFMLRKPLAPKPPSIEESLEDLNKRLPVTLYFHNDIPNPRSWDTTSNVNYIDSYNEYIGMIDKYKKEYSNGLRGEEAADARDDIDDFFLEYVKQGVADLQLFRDLLLEELQRGRKIQMTVKGFASPLAKTDYNVNLTKRRIASMVNYLQAYDNGVFKPYFNGTAENGGRLTVVQVPFGEYEADQITSDNPNDVKNSVYSRAAAIERKIEIQSVDVIREEDTVTTILNAEEQVLDAGEQLLGTQIEKVFTIVNNGDKPITIEDVRIPCECITAETTVETLQPGEKGQVKVIFDTKGYEGHEVKSVYIMYSGADEELRLVITTELK